jgi:hypothetical protein
VGSGQIGDWMASEAASYAFVVAEAERRNDLAALKRLRAIGPPPHTVKGLFTERSVLQRFEGQLGARALLNMGRIVLGRRDHWAPPETSRPHWVATTILAGWKRGMIGF